MNANEVVKALKILETEYTKWRAPIVSLISSRTKDPYQILLSTILSLRTKDAVTARATEKLLRAAKTPYAIIELSEDDISHLIYPVGFYHTKAKNILLIAKILIEKYDGNVPDDLERLLQLPGVGRKTANLVLNEGFGKSAICVDTHVHRISNRWAFVRTKTPEKTEFSLMKILPKKWWIDYNRLLVAFGQTICKPVKPNCRKCPISYFCPKTGVKNE